MKQSIYHIFVAESELNSAIRQLVALKQIQNLSSLPQSNFHSNSIKNLNMSSSTDISDDTGIHELPLNLWYGKPIQKFDATEVQGLNLEDETANDDEQPQNPQLNTVPSKYHKEWGDDYENAQIQEYFEQEKVAAGFHRNEEVQASLPKNLENFQDVQEKAQVYNISQETEGEKTGGSFEVFTQNPKDDPGQNGHQIKDTNDDPGENSYQSKDAKDEKHNEEGK